MGLYKLKVQLNYGRLTIHLGERRNGRKAKEDYRYARKINGCEEEILESIKGWKHPLIASGATTIGSARRAPDEIKMKDDTVGKMRRQNT
jgi:hypothetical protein